VDSHGCIETVNGRLTKLFGYRQVELLGQPVELLLPERYRRSHVALRTGYSASPANRPMGAGRDLQGLRKDGSEFTIKIGWSPITSERGVAVVATVIDITERKAAKRRKKYWSASCNTGPTICLRLFRRLPMKAFLVLVRLNK